MSKTAERDVLQCLYPDTTKPSLAKRSHVTRIGIATHNPRHAPFNRARETRRARGPVSTGP